jgi:hydroxypyruvate reductase
LRGRLNTSVRRKHKTGWREDNDAHVFQALGDSVITGPTLTNVHDFRAIFIAAQHGDLSGSR